MEDESINSCPRHKMSRCDNPDADRCCGGGYDGPCTCEHCHGPSVLDVEVRADTSSGLPGDDSQKAACTLAVKTSFTVDELIEFYGEGNFQSGAKITIPYRATRQMIESQRFEIERLTRELAEAKDALRERIDSEPLRYAMLTQQFRALTEASAAVAEERELLIAERDRLRQALEEIASHRRVFATYERLQHIAEQALSGVPAEAPTDQDALSICSVCGAPDACEHSFAERVAAMPSEQPSAELREISRLRGMASNCLALKPTSGMMRRTLERIAGEEPEETL